MKKSLKTTFATLISLTLFSVSSSFADGDVGKGKEKAATCVACHGADGNSANPLWPKLAGQYEGYLAKQLTDFHDKKRNDATMSAMAIALTPVDIKDLAAYYASLETKAGVADKKKVSFGKTIYKGGNLTKQVTACAGCHGPTGLGNPASNYPRVSGQHAAYIAKQLQDFKKGTRDNDNSSIMRDIAQRMSDKEIEAVSEYMSGLY